MARAFLCLLLWLPLAALADGKVFSRAIAVKTTIPDQRALIHYADGTETLVIETSFIGAGTNFAWVVPVPSMPKVEAVSPALFQSLELILQPRVIHRITHYYWLILIVTALGALIRHYSRRGVEGWVFILVWLFIILFGFLFAIPMWVKSRATAGGPIANPAVQVMDRKQVGVFSTVTLSSKDGGALVSWLNDNGFVTPTNVAPVITDYARQGWLFVAAKINRDAEAVDKAVPHPLAFTFKTEKPVYPLRLTGIENGACAIELYVFGAQRAEISHFKVEHCHAPDYPSIDLNDPYDGAHSPQPGTLRVRNPELRRLVKQSAVATKLTGKLSPAQMREDAFINWVSFEAALPVFYSRHAAAICAVNLFVGMAVSAWLLLALWSKYGWAGRSMRKARTFLLAVTGLVALLAYFAIPKTDIVLIKRGLPSIVIFKLLDGQIQQAAVIRDDAVKAEKYAEPLTFEALRRFAQARTKSDKRDYSEMFINPFTGQDLKHEASPGNLVLRKSTNGVDCVWFDIDAVEHVLATFEE